MDEQMAKGRIPDEEGQATLWREELGELEAAGYRGTRPRLVPRSTRTELAARLGEWLKATAPEDRTCGMCSCTEVKGCGTEANGGHCFWIAPSLCSACAVRLGALVWNGIGMGELTL